MINIERGLVTVHKKKYWYDTKHFLGTTLWFISMWKWFPNIKIIPKINSKLTLSYFHKSLLSYPYRHNSQVHRMIINCAKINRRKRAVTTQKSQNPWIFVSVFYFYLFYLFFYFFNITFLILIIIIQKLI